MQLRFRVLALCLLLLTAATAVSAQVTDTTKPLSDPGLIELSSARSPKEYFIGGVKISGTKYLDDALLLSISAISVGDKILIPGGDNFSKAIGNLWKQNLFSNVQIYYTKVVEDTIYIEIEVQERPRLSNFSFKGAKKSDNEDLEKKTGLVKGRVVTENVKLTAIDNIIKFYSEKGYKGVTVTIEEKPDPALANSESLIFNINKGKKVKVNEVNFYGNSNIAEQKLKKQMKGTKEMTKMTLFPIAKESAFGKNEKMSFKQYVRNYGFLSFSKTRDFLDPYFRLKFSSAKFDETKYVADLDKVIEYYNSLGYRDAEIGDRKEYYTKDGNLNVDIKVKEGDKFYFGNMSWKGNTKYSDSILNLVLGIKKGDVYNVKTLNRKLGKEMTQEGGDISGLYQDDGHLFFRIEPIETAVYNDTIDHEIRLVEGPQATIKNVTIAGNEKTKEYVIRRELRTVPGDKFSRDLLIRSQREIANLGYFNQETIGIDPRPNPDDGTVDINYTVEEKSADQLELSAGWGGGIGLTGTLGVTFNNFSIKNILSKSSWDPLPTGDGQKLSLRVQSNGRPFRSYNFSFTEPWLGGKKRNSLTVSFYNTKYSNSYDYNTGRYSSKGADTSFLKNIGFSVALGKQLKWPDDFFTLVYSLNFTQYKLRNYPNLFPGLRTETATNVSLKVALSRSSVDAPIFPRSGSNFTFSGQFTPPYSILDRSIEKSSNPYRLVEFHKWRFNGEWFVPLGRALGADNKGFVMRAAAKLGFMGRYNNKLGYSPFERFQVGDAGLTNNFGILGYDIIAHRGYPVYDNSDPKINPDKQQANQFFTMFNKYTVELRYPFSTNPSSTIFGLAFFEAANGWYEYKDYNPFRLRRSVGLGARFFLPMFGLLGFDYGIGLDRLQPGAKLTGAAKFTFMLGFEPE
ncbi:MAG: BamA/TamA family outer membrane protein [Chitinophagaceae bacterium]|nr:BamA/TamA family outer membrane protein [Chitinophagaceae bacterium]